MGAGGHSVRFNGSVYEAVSAAIQRRPRLDIYHCALNDSDDGRALLGGDDAGPDRRGWERGVVLQGPVGMRWAGRLRIFRYEVRCWRDGVIPDLQYAIGGPTRITDDPDVARHILGLLAAVPALTWGRDESAVGEMWSCNSIISWLLSRAGIDTDAIRMPAQGRAPGWDAGIAVAAKASRQSSQLGAPAEKTAPPRRSPTTDTHRVQALAGVIDDATRTERFEAQDHPLFLITDRVVADLRPTARVG